MKHTKNNYKNLIDFYIYNEYDDPRNDPHGVLNSIRNDEYNEQAVGEIYDSFYDVEMIRDLDVNIIKEMFVYYCKHGKGYYETLPEEFKIVK